MLTYVDTYIIIYLWIQKSGGETHESTYRQTHR
nr:MAG TPA: hypothetical protein [Caudoviricetes sp.]